MKTTTQPIPWTTYKDENQAHRIAAIRNEKYARPGQIVYVVVEGPGDDEWTVMDIVDAISASFSYSWRAR